MNSSLLRHELASRAARGEIGVRVQWKKRNSRWWWVTSVNVFNLCLISWWWVFKDWVLVSPTPAAALGRVLYIVAVGLGLWAALVSPAIVLTPRFIHRTEPDTLEPLMLVNAGAGHALAYMVVVELVPVLSRIVACIPLTAFAALAGGIGWNDAAMVSGLFLAMGLTQVNLIFALGLIMPNIVAVNLALPLMWAPWLYTQIGTSGLRLDAPQSLVPGLYVHLAAACTSAVVLAYAMLIVKLSRRSGGDSFRRCGGRSMKVGQCPSFAGLIHRVIRGAMGAWGTPPMLGLVTAAGIAVGCIPLFGGLILVIVIVYATCYFLVLLRRTGWWDELWLCSIDPTDWRSGMVQASSRLLLPVVPGLVVHLLAGRLVFEPIWIHYAALLQSTGQVAAAVLGVASLTCVVVIIALILTMSVSVIAMCGFLVKAVEPAVPGDYPVTQPISAMNVVFIPGILAVFLFEGTNAIGPIALLVFCLAIASIAVLFAWLSYHHLRKLLPLISNVDIMVFENVLMSMHKGDTAKSKQDAKRT